MVWLIILFPGVAVIGGIFTFYLAIVSDDGLVKDDYYQQGKQINRVLARDQVANQLGLVADLQFDRQTHRIQLQLTSSFALDYPQKVTLGLYDRTRPGHDRTVTLRKTPDGQYQGEIGEITHGRYNVELGTDSWRLMGLIEIPSEDTIRLNTSPAG